MQRKPSPWTTWQRYLWLAIVTILLVFTSHPSWLQAQEAESTPVAPSLPLLHSLEDLTPSDVPALLAGEERDVVSAPVRLDGRTLFFVAAPVIDPNDRPNDILSADQRAQEIEERLRELARRQLTAQTLDVTWELESSSNQPIIYVNGDFLFTVTALDAQLQGMNNLEIRANELTRVIQRALLRYVQQRQPAFLWRQSKIAAAILLALAVTSYLLTRFQAALKSRKQALANKETIEFDNDHLATALRQQMVNRERRGILDLQRGLLRLGQIALWLGGGFILLGLFPYTRWLQHVILNGLKLPFRLTLLSLIVYWLIRLSNLWVDRLFITLQEGSRLAPEPSERLALRFSTFSQVAKSIVDFIILTIGLLMGLTLLGFQVGPLITGAGIVGLAISLASQNLIRDIINGFLILLEDQYGVGDVIVVGEVAGFVETMNLRITQLRNEEGRLITIPNSQVTIVQNLSKEWSRVDLLIPVALTADLDQALLIVRQVADAMGQDESWGSLILEPPLLLGVDQLDHAGATIRLWIKTRPLKQWDVAREYRRRLKIAFEQAGIGIGVPQQVIHFRNFDGNGRVAHSDLSPSEVRSSATQNHQ
ncbi:putative Small Conductance Mechanosensitive Ion Channel transporter [Halomicronema hongdechloris C2206]|uniref:Small Conductance Mechanosensitive Ion Channel transporter n=1 Tax=Halomicronema hongdechloris C2206 TaxID=1641165 RepID=A0A1Z3HP55_9CYAN|nr:mechanosensitive ion channel family protein [Halomicronema hongdechloris]ASC72078.1 putative Small Conductance Mechanosensitive Ion Channel transporter [Halomicronema hongdechloris C2206]